MNASTCWHRKSDRTIHLPAPSTPPSSSFTARLPEHRHHQSSLSLALSLSPPHIHAISHSHTSQPDLSSVCPMNLLLWFAHLRIYRPFSVTRSLFPVIPWEAYPTFISFFSFLQLYFLNWVVSLYFLLHWPTEGLKRLMHSNHYNFLKIFRPLFGHTSPKSHSRLQSFIHKCRSDRHRPCSARYWCSLHILWCDCGSQWTCFTGFWPPLTITQLPVTWSTDIKTLLCPAAKG